MIGAMLIGACIGVLCHFAFCFAEAGGGGWDLRSDERRQFDRQLKWGINPRVMRWLIPVIVVGIYAYGFYLKYLGLI